MHHVRIPDLPWIEQVSPRKKFHSFCQNISVALGSPRNAGLWAGGHPFDVQIRRIPPGAAVCPFHSHLAQWEFFLVRAGTGTVRTSDGIHPVKTGDFFVHPPGAPHQLTNTSTSDLEVLIVADNPQLDSCHYPDSNKFSLRPPGKFFRMVEAEYFDGEEEPLPDAPPYQAASAPAVPAVAPFPKRKLNLDDLPWDKWESPKKKFRAMSKELSIALGAKRNTPTGLGGHPFDLEYGKVAPGDSGCPYHSHSAQWELFIFLAGTASVRTPEGSKKFGAGDVVLHMPGEAHQFYNAGSDDVIYLLIADSPSSDIWFYPDSNKWGHNRPRKFFRGTDIDYWEGEE